jgi:hypothetical protein
MHFGTYKASQDREHNVAFERLEREIRSELLDEGFEPGPELDAQARREMSAQIENVGIPEHLFDDPQGVKRASYFLDIRNPMRVEDAQAVTERWAELEELARKQGHDALVYSNAVEDRGRDSYVPLNARPQVKAVTAREFNMDDPDVHKAGGGLVRGLKSLRKGLAAADPEALTPAARLKDADEQLRRLPEVIKKPGGNWLTGSVEQAVQPLKRDTPEIARWDNLVANGGEARALMHMNRPLQSDVALNRWIDKKLTPYIKNDMATERDPVRALAERGVTHVDAGALQFDRAPKSGPSEILKKMGRSDPAKAWESAADTSLSRHYTENFSDQARPKWLKPGVPAYGLGKPDNLGFDHLMDVLREQLATGALTPQQLDKVSISNAVERAHAYNLEREAARKAALAADLESMTPYKAYDDGWRWVQLDRPGQFAAESDAMGHSVRGYEPPRGHKDWVSGSGNSGSPGYGLGGWDAITSGRAKIYSLKDKNGKTYATVEAGPGEDPIDTFYRQLPEEAQRQLFTDVYGSADRYGRFNIEDDGSTHRAAIIEAIHKRHPEASFAAPALSIRQLKGPGNGKISPEALSYAQDFVRSGNWRDVRDLNNVGLRHRDEMFRPDELKLYHDRGGDPMPNYPTREQANALLRLISSNPNYVYDEGLTLRGDGRP